MEFMSWLYQNYIKTQLDPQIDDLIAFSFSSLENGLEWSCRQDLERVKEFWAVRAFLLGLRLGQGLSDATRACQ